MTFTFGDPPEVAPTEEYELAQARLEATLAKADAHRQELMADYWQDQHIQATRLVGLLMAQLQDEYPDGMPIDLDGLKDAPVVEVLRVQETDDWSTERVLRIKKTGRKATDDDA
jgi:hypothetical protein